MRETHLLVLQKKEKLFLALSLAAVVLCTVLAFGFAVPLQAAESQVLPDTTGLDWAQVLPRAIESLDDHVIKLVHCCWRERAHSPHYLAVAARAVGLLDAASHPQRP